MIRVLFSAEEIRELLDFAWAAAQREQGRPRAELESWPELAFNAERGSVCLFPVVDPDMHGPRPVVRALGDGPALAAAVAGTGWVIFGVEVCAVEDLPGEGEIGFLIGEEVVLVAGD